MRVCDICKSDNADYNMRATVNGNEDDKQLELCYHCCVELTQRTKQHKHLAYIETIKARNGEIPCKSHWWDRLTW